MPRTSADARRQLSAAAERLDRAYQGRPRDYEKIRRILPSAVRLLAEVSKAGLMKSHELEHHAAAIGGWGYVSVAFDDRDVISELEQVAELEGQPLLSKSAFAERLEERGQVLEAIRAQPGIANAILVNRFAPERRDRVSHMLWTMRDAGLLVDQKRSNRIFLWLPDDPSAPRALKPEEAASAVSDVPLPPGVEQRIDALKVAWKQFDRWAESVELTDVLNFPRNLARGDLSDLCFLDGDLNQRLVELWGSATTSRIVPSPHPDVLARVGRAVGEVPLIWSEMLAWAYYRLKGPYSHPEISELPTYQRAWHHEAARCGRPIDEGVYRRLRDFDETTGMDRENPLYELVLTDDDDEMQEVKGELTESDCALFRTVRDMVTEHRRAWAHEHLSGYLHMRWQLDALVALETIRLAKQDTAVPLPRSRLNVLVKDCSNTWLGGDGDALRGILRNA